MSDIANKPPRAAAPKEEPPAQTQSEAKASAAVDAVKAKTLHLMPSEWEQKLFERGWLPAIVLIPVIVLFLLGLSVDVYTWQMVGGAFHLENAITYGLDAIYVSFALMMMAVIWLFQRFLKKVPGALIQLDKTGQLLPAAPTEEANRESMVENFLNRYRASLTSRLRFVLLGAILFLFGAVMMLYVANSFSFSLQTFPAAIFTIVVVLKWCIFPLLWAWLAAMALWVMLVSAYYIHRLADDFDIEVIPSHPDRCGGLKPVGDVCLHLAEISLIASLVLAYWGSIGQVLRLSGVLPKSGVSQNAQSFILDLTREPQPITRAMANIGTLAGILGGAWLFFYPMLGIHADMKRQKAKFSQQLADTAVQFDREMDHALDAKDYAIIKEAQGKLNTLQSTMALLKDYPEWPIERKVFLKFLTPQFFSVLGLLINFDSKILQTLLNWLGLSGGA